jgi:hypothetical protein
MRKLNSVLLVYLLLLMLAQTSGTQTPAITYATAPNAADCTPERVNWSAHVAQIEATYYCNGTSWVPWSAAGGVPSGLTAMVVSGSCPSGYTEVSALNGAMPYGTLNANGNIGTTGGADSVTPTVASLTAAAQTFTGSSATTSAVSAGTPSGTNGTAAFTPAGTVTPDTFGTTKFTTSGSGTAAFTSVTGGHVFTGTAGTVPAETFTGSAMATHTHTLTATGTNGTSAVSGTLNSIDNRSAFVRVIFCTKV